MEEHQFINNKDESRYELHVGQYIAFAQYTTNDEGVIHITHTKTPEQLSGRGIASELIQKVLEDIKSQGSMVLPICSFVVNYISRHQEWQSLVKS